MKDIIEQLEEGKRNQENGEFNSEDLRTRLETEEEIKEEIKTPKKRSSKKQKEETPEVPMDPFAQAEQIIKESTGQIEETKEKAQLVDPEFDFANFYEKGQKIYYIRVFEKLGTKELLELKVRTAYPRFLVTCEDKKACVCIGYDGKDMIFEDRKEALKVYNKIHVKAITYTSDLDVNKTLKENDFVDEEESEDYLANETDIAATEEE
jgi:hypothetical protein